jgi:hypothetical protein
MAESTIAFLPQPVQVMASQGEAFSEDVITTLHEWEDSKRTAHVRASHGGKVFGLSPKTNAGWTVIVILHHSGRGEHAWANVCAVDFGGAVSAVEQFAPLMDVEHLRPAMEVNFRKMTPKMFVAMAIGQGYPDEALGANLTARHRSRHHVLATVDAVSHRWVQSNARNNFRELLERARQQPQIVERDGEDLILLSKQYLQELVEPTSARAMALRYRANALSASGMAEPIRRRLGRLDDLPELGAA